MLHFIIFHLYSIHNAYYSQLCGTANIDANESEFGAINAGDDEIANINEMDIDSESVSSEIQSIIADSEDMRPDSQLSSRPNSSSCYSFDSQEVRIFWVYFSN